MPEGCSLPMLGCSLAMPEGCSLAMPESSGWLRPLALRWSSS